MEADIAGARKYQATKLVTPTGFGGRAPYSQSPLTMA